MAKTRPAFGLLVILAATLAVAGCTSGPPDSESQAPAPPAYEPDWASLSRNESAPEWLRDSNHGIYIHWGVYSVPAFSTEW
jgi:alpha-L-fucosidase